MLLRSWRTYENYTGPLGLEPHRHYSATTTVRGASEHNGWGQWHRADEKGVGMDRTVATGTGYIGQYPPAVQAFMNRSPPAPTICSSSCITCRTPTSCIPARP